MFYSFLYFTIRYSYGARVVEQFLKGFLDHVLERLKYIEDALGEGHDLQCEDAMQWRGGMGCWWRG